MLDNLIAPSTTRAKQQHDFTFNISFQVQVARANINFIAYYRLVFNHSLEHIEFLHAAAPAD